MSRSLFIHHDIIHNEAVVTSRYFSLLLVFYVSPLIIDRFYWVYWYLFMAIGVSLHLGVLLMYWVYLTSFDCISSQHRYLSMIWHKK
ncbi:hypothetical protein ACR56S_11830 [Staphylococcus hominis]|uniref:hypothetical protein n=1 Tax=Staphylococcus hominis TaxID=1290 RepID=UPI003DA126A1